ncbi:MAG TPA: class I SAM-dependent methyltransferase [Polyangiaceae bacterium]|nr:class I SAM-dependent methyltransferase [Polyangiaceae bacterium]
MDATRRFSNRVAEYVEFRPGYPDGVFSALAQRLSPELPRVAADIGAGTGIFSRGLLAHGFEVFAVEPNAEMRAAAEASLAAEARFHSGGGRAEASALPDASVALVSAAQSFHWFDPEQCRREWRRILMPGGIVAVIWNERRLGSSFLQAYEAAMRALAEYDEVHRRQRDRGTVRRLFEAQPLETLEYFHQQTFDWRGLRGRVLSSSYVPQPGAPGHDELMGALRQAYEAHQHGGHVQFDYVTRVHVGRL